MITNLQNAADYFYGVGLANKAMFYYWKIGQNIWFYCIFWIETQFLTFSSGLIDVKYISTRVAALAQSNTAVENF